MEKIMVFIPMYNCEKQIVRVLKQFDKELLEYVSEIVVINNLSTDDGEQAVLDFAKKSNKLNITLLRNNENYNLGGSHKVAFDYAIKNNYDYVVVLHGDDQGDIHDLLPFLKNNEYKNYDCLLGSRFLKESKLKGYSKFRTFGNIVYNFAFSILLGTKVKDLGSGLNMYKVEALKSKYYLKYPDRLTFNCYMLLAIKSYNQKIKYFPITWREDDQVSNVKMVSQAFKTIVIPIKYFFKKDKYLEEEHREKVIDDYSASCIMKLSRRK